MRLNIDVDADGGLLDQIARRAESPQPALRSAGDLFRAREARVFATGNDGNWAALDPGTVRRKGSARVLVNDGGLLRSLTVRGARYHVERITSEEAVFGTRNPVAHLHRQGARGMPPRNPVPPVSFAEREQIASTLLGFIVDGQT